MAWRHHDKNGIFFLSHSTGPEKCLSNFFPTEIRCFGKLFSSSEHLYQYSKAVFAGCHKIADEIHGTQSASAVKRISRKIPLKGTVKEFQWNNLKFNILKWIAFSKFKQNDTLRAYLISTRGRKLYENNSKDSYWGIGKDGFGKNQMGLILETIRNIFQTQHRHTIHHSLTTGRLIIGDSLVRSINICNCTTICLPGAKIGEVFMLADLAASTGYADCILVHVGTNSLNPRVKDRSHCKKKWKSNLVRKGKSPKKVGGWLKKAVNDFTTFNPTVKLIVSALLHRPCDENLKKAKNTQKCNTVVKNGLENFINVQYFHSILANPSTDVKYFNSDGLHLSANGTSIFRDEIRNQFDD